MSTTKKSCNKHVVISITLFIIFILLPISGIMLVKTKDNPDAFTNQFWDAIHSILGALFILFGILHIINNWKVLKHYIKGK